jgi:hypothetical protein
MGGHGGENIDLANEGQAATMLVDMGIRVTPGASYTVSFFVAGDTQDEFGCSLELVFQDEEVETPKQWQYLGATTVTVNVLAQGTDRTQTARTLDPGPSTEIGGIIGCCVGDMAALGVNHGVAIATGGVERQEWLLGGVGGELIIGAGASNPPTQKHHLHCQVKPGESVRIDFMSIIEAGVVDCAISVGFVVPA